MNESLKRWLGIAAILLLILFGMGIIFPWIVSTSTLPISIILILVIVILTSGIALIWHIVKYMLVGARAMKIIKKHLKDKESKK